MPEKLRKALATGDVAAPGIDSLARQLHAQRLAPLAPHLNGVKTLYVVAVNEMAGLPLDVLTRDYTISYLPSGTFLAGLKDRAPVVDRRNMLVLADPVFARSDAQSDPDGPYRPADCLCSR